MDKDIKMIYDEEAGGLKEYQEPYTKIDCATEDDFYILLNFVNTPICEIGKYIEDGDGGGAYYVGDDEKSCLRYGLFVDAWMPLPEPYKEE